MLILLICSPLMTTQRGFMEPRIEFLRKGKHGAAIRTFGAMHRQSEVVFPPLHCTNTAPRVLCDLFPRIKGHQQRHRPWTSSATHDDVARCKIGSRASLDRHCAEEMIRGL
jgi:hypothetical protein